MKHFYYLAKSGSVIRIRAARKPSRHTMPARGTWIVSEFNGALWHLACCPEITLRGIEQLAYIGSVEEQ